MCRGNTHSIDFPVNPLTFIYQRKPPGVRDIGKMHTLHCTQRLTSWNAGGKKSVLQMYKNNKKISVFFFFGTAARLESIEGVTRAVKTNIGSFLLGHKSVYPELTMLFQVWLTRSRGKTCWDWKSSESEHLLTTIHSSIFRDQITGTFIFTSSSGTCLKYFPLKISLLAAQTVSAASFPWQGAALCSY